MPLPRPNQYCAPAGQENKLSGELPAETGRPKSPFEATRGSAVPSAGIAILWTDSLFAGGIDTLTLRGIPAASMAARRPVSEQPHGGSHADVHTVAQLDRSGNSQGQGRSGAEQSRQGARQENRDRDQASLSDFRRRRP